MARKKSFNPTEGLFSFPDPPKEKVPESAPEPKQVIKSEQTVESTPEPKQVIKSEQTVESEQEPKREPMATPEPEAEPKKVIKSEQTVESEQVIKPELEPEPKAAPEQARKSEQAIEPGTADSQAREGNKEPELKVKEHPEPLPKADLSADAEQIITESRSAVAESQPEVKEEIAAKGATGIIETDGESTQVANVTPEEEIVRCTFRVTKVHAFYVQKTAVQKNSNINIVMTDILSKWLSEEISISDEEAISIIDSFAKERSSYINRTYGIPVSLREEFNNKAAEIGLKHTVLINHIIHEAMNSVE